MTITPDDIAESIRLSPGGVLRYKVGENRDRIFVVCMAHDPVNGSRPVEIVLSRTFAMQLASDIVNEFHVTNPFTNPSPNK